MVATSTKWWHFLSARREPYLSNGEPSLDDMLNEPIIRLMMDRDGINPRSLRATLSEMSRRVAERMAVGTVERRPSGVPPLL